MEEIKLSSEPEAEAHTYDCYAALLDTLSFQARPFYERPGYEVFAELLDFPRPGMARYYMRKTLRALT